MKKYKIKESLFSRQLLDENEKIIGETLLNLISGFKEKIKIDNEVFKITHTGFLWNDIKVFDRNKKLVLKSDISKDRLIYFGNEVEIFTYKGNGWFNNKLDLFRKNELIVSIKSKEFFKTKYMIEVENDFENYVVILTFLSSYISSQGS